jgi:hypothetical protein
MKFKQVTERLRLFNLKISNGKQRGLSNLVRAF